MLNLNSPLTALFHFKVNRPQARLPFLRVAASSTRQINLDSFAVTQCRLFASLYVIKMGGFYGCE